MIMLMTKLYLLSIFHCQTPCQASCKHDRINGHMAASKCLWAIVQMTRLRLRQVA